LSQKYPATSIVGHIIPCDISPQVLVCLFRFYFALPEDNVLVPKYVEQTTVTFARRVHKKWSLLRRRREKRDEKRIVRPL
jgi:hypothetical protein